MTTETFWMAGGLFELSYNISSSTTTPHEIESYAKTTGDGTQAVSYTHLRAHET